MNALPPLLADRIAVEGECWISRGSDVRGYRRITWNGKRQYAHRVVYEQMVGPVPDGLDLDHLCRVRSCCRPDHLEPVTRAENIRRGDIGRINGERAAQRTHCPQNHPYDDENTYHGRGQRHCRECSRASARRYKARIRQQGSAA